MDAQLGSLSGAVAADESDPATREDAALIASAEGEADGWSTFETVEQLAVFSIEDAEQR